MFIAKGIKSLENGLHKLIIENQIPIWNNIKDYFQKKQTLLDFDIRGLNII